MEIMLTDGSEIRVGQAVFYFVDPLVTRTQPGLAGAATIWVVALIGTILAIIIACLGLIGLTSFMVERKTKEISVRRVHGATVSQVNTLLSKEFLWLIMVANLISWPIAWFGVHRWLDNFSRHIDVQWYLFLISALVTVFITVMITSIHALRASRMNPADTLKYE